MPKSSLTEVREAVDKLLQMDDLQVETYVYEMSDGVHIFATIADSGRDEASAPDSDSDSDRQADF